MPAAKLPSQEFEFQEPYIVKLTDEERDTGVLSPENVAYAIAAMHKHGLVVLENAVDVAHADKLNSILSTEAEHMAKLPTTHFNDNSLDGRPTGNMSQGPPLDPSLMYEDIWANKPASTVISSILGPNPRLNYVNGNTALGGYDGARQRIHADLTFNHAQFLFAIGESRIPSNLSRRRTLNMVVTNYYLIDVGPFNGSTEIWLGSHRDTSFRDHRNCLPDLSGISNTEYDKKIESEFGIRDELIEARRQWAPPIQPSIKKGSVVLRDLRLWHAGLANPTPDPRIMLAFVHTPWWYQCPAKVVLPEAAKELVESWGRREISPVKYHAHFVPKELDHTKVKFNPNFSSANKGYLKQLPLELGMGYVFKLEEDEAV